jgi:predicted N-acetyltransferase YhbS
MSHLVISEPFPRISLPDGFRLKSLADDNDLRKVHRLFWRGFGHGDEPPDDGIKNRRFMQSAPNFRKDLNIVVEAPDGNFVSYCGMWYEPVNRIAYVEPVATDPDYRRKGLGRAAVLEGVRRCGDLGATVAYVGTAKPFYLSFGFRPIYTCSVWRREWS